MKLLLIWQALAAPRETLSRSTVPHIVFRGLLSASVLFALAIITELVDPKTETWIVLLACLGIGGFAYLSLTDSFTSIARWLAEIVLLVGGALPLALAGFSSGHQKAAAGLLCALGMFLADLILRIEPPSVIRRTAERVGNLLPAAFRASR